MKSPITYVVRPPIDIIKPVTVYNEASDCIQQDALLNTIGRITIYNRSPYYIQ